MKRYRAVANGNVVTLPDAAARVLVPAGVYVEIVDE